MNSLLSTSCAPAGTRRWSGTAYNTGYMRRRFAPWPSAHLPYGQTSYTPGTLYDISGAMEMIYKMKKEGVIKYE